MPCGQQTLLAIWRAPVITGSFTPDFRGKLRRMTSERGLSMRAILAIIVAELLFAAWPAVRDRESPGRQRQYRNRPCGEGRARWLHHRHQPRRTACHQYAAVRENAL